MQIGAPMAVNSINQNWIYSMDAISFFKYYQSCSYERQALVRDVFLIVSESRSLEQLQETLARQLSYRVEQQESAPALELPQVLPDERVL